jgi:hypothetical protein
MYDGSTDVEEWVDKFKLLREVNGNRWGNNDQERAARAVTEIRLAMHGKTNEWIRTLAPDRLQNPDDILNDLIGFIQGPYYLRDTRDKATTLKQLDCGNVTEYYIKKMKLLTLSFPGNQNNAIVTQFLLDGLAPEIKEWVYREAPDHRDTPTKIKDLALGFERIHTTRAQMESINATILEDHMAKNVHLEEKLEKVIKEL